MLRRYVTLRREHGQSLAEYALILALIATVVVALVAALGPVIATAFSEVVAGF
jgi:Flp pilus assembly pilin Flp